MAVANLLGKRSPVSSTLGGPLIAAWLIFFPGWTSTGTTRAAEIVSYSRDVLPILADRCFHCHGPDEKQRQADLRLDDQQSALADRDGHAAIVPGNPDASDLLQRVTSSDPDVQMPPPESHRGALTEREIATLRAWIVGGAPWGRHWAFETPRRPALPTIANRAWPRNGVDWFVAARLEAEGLQPSPEADQRTLIRRVALDLTGLPPTRAEVNAFVADESPLAYERLVDRLLASPRYGVRMAWPWLDAARYADTSGYQDDPERTMWPWRDWAIDALNANMPFDQFTIEQLAGDLLPNATPEQRLATGFNRNHMHNAEGGRIEEETRVENVFDRVETTGAVWLGLTLQCARCHDHKFDPTSNRDYFAFFDFFNQSSESGPVDRSVAVPPAMDYVPARIQTQLADAVSQIESLEKRLAALGSTPGAPLGVDDRAQQDVLARSLERARQRRAWLEPRVQGVKVMVMDALAQPRATFILSKGLYDNPTDVQAFANVPSMLPALAPPRSGARYDRLDLARWLVAPENPLTARVAVNRYWQLFFGRGIVTTPDDFGLQGARPTHPELLDWLALEFVESGWDVKRLHKLLTTSAAYRQSARVSQELLERDPENALLARAPRGRMPSWMLRDQALFASGLLAETMGGPPVKPYGPDVWSEATFGQKRYEADSGEALYRRSAYAFWRRIVGPTMFFDVAKRQTCEVQAQRTNTPLHALTTLNDAGSIEAARTLAQEAMRQSDACSDRIAWMFETLTSRSPARKEVELLERRTASLIDHFRNSGQEAHNLLSVGETPRDPSLDPAEHAAYAVVSNLLMNLDETLVRP